MFLTRLATVALVCLLAGCQQEKNPDDFGEVIYEIPVLPDEDPGTEAKRQ